MKDILEPHLVATAERGHSEPIILPIQNTATPNYKGIDRAELLIRACHLRPRRICMRFGGRPKNTSESPAHQRCAPEVPAESNDSSVCRRTRPTRRLPAGEMPTASQTPEALVRLDDLRAGDAALPRLPGLRNGRQVNRGELIGATSPETRERSRNVQGQTLIEMRSGNCSALERAGATWTRSAHLQAGRGNHQCAPSNRSDTRKRLTRCLDLDKEKPCRRGPSPHTIALV